MSADQSTKLVYNLVYSPRSERHAPRTGVTDAVCWLWRGQADSALTLILKVVTVFTSLLQDSNYRAIWDFAEG